MSNFINSYYQYRDLQQFANSKRILIIGPGQGLDAVVLRWRGYDVVTFDIDQTFAPDVIGSVHDMSMFKAQQFDVAIASHVLEHLPIEYFEPALQEISRVSRSALIYLPVTGRSMQLRCRPGVKNWDWSIVIDVFNWLRRPDARVSPFLRRPTLLGGRPSWLWTPAPTCHIGQTFSSPGRLPKYRLVTKLQFCPSIQVVGTVMRVVYSFNKKGHEAAFWQEEILGASADGVEFIPFNHDPYMDVSSYLRAQLLDNIYFERALPLLKLYSDLEALLARTSADVLLVDNCPPYHPSFCAGYRSTRY